MKLADSARFNSRAMAIAALLVAATAAAAAGSARQFVDAPALAISGRAPTGPPALSILNGALTDQARSLPDPVPVSRDDVPLEMKTLEGRSVSLRDLRGEVVILNFWATWCKPCITEMPVLAKLAQRFGSRGLRVIAASVDETASREELAQFAEKLPRAMEVWVGATMADIERMRVQGLPTTVIIDRAGSLIRVHHGAIPEGFLDDSLEELLESRGPAQPKPAPSVPAPKPDKRRFSEASEA
jgi:cytochrome c biogenesis protein CcmG, thiol:disulfide interchange protein DsbE